jgi:hypothetical protein
VKKEEQMSKLHLDSEYRNRWEEFHLADGTIMDSRQINWREVAWDQVVKITAHLRGNVYEVDNSGPGFRAFMNFRWAGMEAQYDKNKKYMGHKKINSWVIGWTDGVLCFQKNIDFKTGLLIEECRSPIQQFIGHIHPAVKHLFIAKMFKKTAPVVTVAESYNLKEK